MPFETTWRPFRAVSAYYFTMLMVVLAAGWSGIIPAVNETTLLRFDAIHYHGIMQHGYANESSAFFPLFPLTWKVSGLGTIGISIFNGILFISCTLLLLKELGTALSPALVFASVPSIFFLFTPYSESIFFLGSTALLIAVRRNLPWVAAVAIFCCTLARPAFTALLPALFITVLVGSGSTGRKVWNSLLFLVVSVLAMLAVMAIQHQQTGDYFGFYKAQESFGNTFGIPDLPFSSWGGGSIVRLDAVALLVGILSAVALVRIILNRLNGSSTTYPPELVLSLGYIAGISIMALLLRKGELFSLNRFVFATPFFLVLLTGLVEHTTRLDRRWPLLGWLALELYFLLFASFVHIQTFLYYNLVALYLIVVVHILHPPKKRSTPLFWVWIIIAMVIQLFYLQRYLGDRWVA